MFSISQQQKKSQKDICLEVSVLSKCVIGGQRHSYEPRNNLVNKGLTAQRTVVQQDYSRAVNSYCEWHGATLVWNCNASLRVVVMLVWMRLLCWQLYKCMANAIGYKCILLNNNRSNCVPLLNILSVILIIFTVFSHFLEKTGYNAVMCII